MNKKIVFVVSMILVVLGVVFFKKESELSKKNGNDIAVSNPPFEVLASKEAFIDKQDGWIYYLHVSKKAGTEKLEFNFDGVNIKYQELPGYYIPVKDKNGKEIDKASGTPMLSRSVKYKYDTSLINNYLNKKQFVSEISEDDLVNLELQLLTKGDIVALVNQVCKLDFVNIDSDIDMLYAPGYISAEQIIDENTVLQFGYYNRVGVVQKTWFDVIYQQGEKRTYLSDMVVDGSATNEQKELYSNLKNIGETIIQTQKFNVKKQFVELTNKEYDVLFSKLEVMQTNMINVKKFSKK